MSETLSLNSAAASDSGHEKSIQGLINAVSVPLRDAAYQASFGNPEYMDLLEAPQPYISKYKKNKRERVARQRASQLRQAFMAGFKPVAPTIIEVEIQNLD